MAPTNVDRAIAYATNESAPASKGMDATPNLGDEKKEYVVDSMVRHVGEREGTRYVVRSYGYGPHADTKEPPDHIPPNFIARYWRSKRSLRTRR